MAKSRYTMLKELKFDSYIIDCPVEIEKGALLFDNELNAVLLQLKLFNVGSSVISSVHTVIDGFNYAGEAIPDLEPLQYVYKDLNAGVQTAFFGDKTPIVLDKRVNDVKVTITKVTTVDGEVWEYNGAEPFTSPGQLPINSLETSLINQLNKEIQNSPIEGWDKIKYIPRQREDLWLCSCGRPNPNTSVVCSRCGMSRDWIFEKTDKDYLTFKINEYNETLIAASAVPEVPAETAPLADMEEEWSLEELRARETAAITDRQKQERRYKWTLRAAAFIGLVITGALLWFLVLPMVNYSRGVSLYESRQYPAAIKVFEGMGEYKNASSWLLAAKYKQAVSLMGNKRYEESAALFETIKDYSNAKDMIKEVSYQKAGNYLAEKKYTEAIALYEKIPEYSNASELAKEARYQYAVDLLNAPESLENYQTAIGQLESIQGYKNSTELLAIAKANLEIFSQP